MKTLKLIRKILRALLIICFALLAGLSNSTAQISISTRNDTTPKNDTSRFSIGNTKVLIISPKEDKDSLSENDTSKHSKRHNEFEIYWSGFGLGINGYLNANNKTNVPTGYDFLELKYPSYSWTLNLLETNIPLWKKHINIITGFGFEFNSYRFKNNYKLLPDSNFISGRYDSTVTFKRNKLEISYFNVPLLLQFDTKPFGENKRTLHFSAGVVGGIRLASSTFQKYDIKKAKYENTTKDDFNLNPFRYSAMARIGYGNLDLWASYSLSTLFKKNEGPQLYPFNVGITLIGL